jgi:hypothetical protein
VTADHLTYACTLGADLVDFLGTLFQGAWFIGGALVGLAAIVALSVFFRRV